MAKYIFVTGGVTSSLGKGIIASSLAMILQSRGLRVTIQKFDPYINVDPGTLNPYEHGECFVTEDGAETDLDLGHYERFLDVSTSQANNVTTGRIYLTVIEKERKGDYLGKTVQIVPHITDEIKRRMLILGNSTNYDIVITELGGTVGDIESLPYIEAVRQLRWEIGSQNCIIIHLTLVPYLKAAKELKTKPTQHSVKEMSSHGIQPDVLICRTEWPLNREVRKKLALFCNVDLNAVVEARDADTIYDVPLHLIKERLDETVLEKLRITNNNEPRIDEWKNFLKKLKNPEAEIKIALVGKYVELQDAYKSIHESLIHAAAHNQVKINLVSIQSEKISSENVGQLLTDVAGILVAPGFGTRGVKGKIAAIRYAREMQIPFFGICLGMQCAVVEFARNVLHLEDANSTEMDVHTPHPVIHLMEEQKKVSKKGGTMRLGAYDCDLIPGSDIADIYGQLRISERHRHRYEFNNHYLDDFINAGMIACGINPPSRLVEIFQYKHHPWFFGVQFHPELKSRVTRPHPLFKHFIKAAIIKQHQLNRLKDSLTPMI